MTRNAQATMATIASALLRLAAGALFMVHGWQKLDEGVPATTSWLQSLELPYPTLAAPVLIGVELLGGAALVLGVATRFVALVLLVEMAAAWYLVHRGQGFFVQEGGWELVALLAVVLAGFALTGSGRSGLDRLLGRRRR